MASFKGLAKDTVIYGMSSIVGRFLNYLLVPLYTAKIAAESGGYGVVTNVYAYTALILVLLTFGMETTFFRFSNKEEENKKRVFSTSLICVSTLAVAFFLLVLLFLPSIASFLGYADHPEYVWTMAATVSLDAIQAIPFAYLRYQHRPMRFFTLKMLFIVLNIVLNLFAFLVMPAINGHATDVVWVFYINLFCTGIVTFFFYRELAEIRYGFDSALMRRMFKYSWPILVLGLAGILNQAADKILYPKLVEGHQGQVDLGIYGAAVKIAMIMAMITQAFRYAYEPIVFGKAHDKDSKEYYAKAMKYFLIFTLLAFLAVVAYIGILRYIIGRDYWDGLRVVPIVMAAEIMMGVYFNLSFWYKLIDETIWGLWFSLAGCIVLLLVNIIFVPKMGYIACAWGGFAGYATAMVLSYVVGQKRNPIRYPMHDIMIYVLLTTVLFVGMTLANQHLPVWAAVAVNTLLLAVFVVYIVKKDFPISALIEKIKRRRTS